MKKERTYAREVKEGKCLLKGLVYDVRDLGSLKFLLLRDVSGIVQVTAKKEKTPSKVFELIGKINRESVVEIEGNAVKNKQAPGGIEVLPKKISVLSEAEKPLPIDVSERSKTELPKRLDWRALDLRRPSVNAIFKIRSNFLFFCCEWLTKNGFIQINTPKITSCGIEGGANLFPLVYFEKAAFLAQSPQLYKQEVQSGLEKVFEIGNYFRAEKFHTTRHLCEFTAIDIELSFIEDEEDVMSVCESMLRDVMKRLKEESEKELKLLGAKIKVPRLPFPSIKVSEALKMLGKKEIDTEAEEKLGRYALEKYDSEFLWLRNFPFEVKPFYTMKKDERYCRDFDLLFKGLEIVTGSQREHRYSELLKQAKEKNIDIRNFESYLNVFRYGMPPHGGLGFGVDRFIKQLLGLENVREAVLFPRDPERLLP